jgi:hypothetical protein
VPTVAQDPAFASGIMSYESPFEVQHTPGFNYARETWKRVIVADFKEVQSSSGDYAARQAETCFCFTQRSVRGKASHELSIYKCKEPETANCDRNIAVKQVSPHAAGLSQQQIDAGLVAFSL